MFMGKVVNTVWFTGPSGAGKTSLAYGLNKYLKDYVVLDGDHLRSNVYKDLGLGFSCGDRRKNVLLTAKICKFLNDNDIDCLVSVIAPDRTVRAEVSNLLGDRYFEVYVHAALDVLIDRDPKGLYRKAIDGEIKGLTGFDGKYDIPFDYDVEVDTGKSSLEDCVEKVLIELALSKLRRFSQLRCSKDKK